jgi:2-C-methyl-D-erythritol 4-phosphate cytidylyltransferase/2-C-methyl-D-erythritol 2,4-cyclodiphosphate synthase
MSVPGTPPAASPRHIALIPAAGRGERLAAGVPKQYLPLAGRPMIVHAIEALLACARVDAVHVLLAPDDDWLERGRWRLPAGRVRAHRCGGVTRAETVANGLEAIASGAAADDWVLVHDAARPCLGQDELGRLLDELAGDPVGGLLALPCTDTVKRADGGAAPRVAATEPRERLWGAQTPQMFRLRTLREALARAGAAVTDEAGAVEALGLAPRLVHGAPTNLKVTWPSDMVLAERLLAARSAAAPGERAMQQRIGQGFDVHRLVAGRRCVIGGVEIPYERGLDGHSDADVLLHAICDALLGAAALGDIGRHFPDTDPRNRDIDSRGLLRHVAALVAGHGWQVVNVDATIVAEAPRMAPHIGAMCANIAADLGIDRGCVSVKATTTETLGFTGRGEGIAAQAIALLTSR